MRVTVQTKAYILVFAVLCQPFRVVVVDNARHADAVNSWRLSSHTDRDPRLTCLTYVCLPDFFPPGTCGDVSTYVFLSFPSDHCIGIQ